ncbi:MAG: hypothetical protein H6978_07335 [Gammaproteobacteria bacterium]|nr:hypothetical protein [Gammaproteobacteria bacterium]
MTEFSYFLGRFHVLALHLPIGMLLMTVVAHFLSLGRRREQLRSVLPLLWGMTALSAMLTVVLGMLHFTEGGFTGASAYAHRAWGISFMLATLLTWFVVAVLPNLYRAVGTIACLVLLALVTMTGHYGGNLTHGDTYLVEYAPAPLRALAGIAPRRAPVTEIGAADPYHDVIAPMLAARCGNCHNNDKQSGELNLRSLAALKQGGKSGQTFVAGDAQHSEVYRRITLPKSHDDFMPAEGKTPLTDGQVALLRWWIDAGMPADTTVAQLQVADDVSGLLAVELGLATATGGTGVAVSNVASLSEDALAAMQDQNLLVRPLTQTGGGYVVSNAAPGSMLSDEAVAAVSLAAGSAVELNLAGAGLEDGDLAGLRDFSELKQLNLSLNNLTDASLAAIAGLPRLEVLNIYGNAAITDAGLAALGDSGSLRKVYVWGTGVSPSGIEALKTRQPAVEIIGAATTAASVPR